MTTLTRIYLNPAKRGGRKLLTNPQAMHAAVRGAFPPDIDTENSRVLWRVDNRQHEHILYILGPERPDAHHIVEQAGWETRPAETADYAGLLNRITEGQKWRFELAANPVSSKSRGEGKRGRIVAHVTADQQMQWLLERSERDGFVVVRDEGENLQARVTKRDVLRFRRTEKRPVTLHTARFTGVLEVKDPERFRQTLTHGLGRAKAYGCGLMTLAPIEQP